MSWQSFVEPLIGVEENVGFQGRSGVLTRFCKNAFVTPNPLPKHTANNNVRHTLLEKSPFVKFFDPLLLRQTRVKAPK